MRDPLTCDHDGLTHRGPRAGSASRCRAAKRRIPSRTATRRVDPSAKPSERRRRACGNAAPDRSPRGLRAPGSGASTEYSMCPAAWSGRTQAGESRCSPGCCSARQMLPSLVGRDPEHEVALRGVRADELARLVGHDPRRQPAGTRRSVAQRALDRRRCRSPAEKAADVGERDDRRAEQQQRHGDQQGNPPERALRRRGRRR